MMKNNFKIVTKVILAILIIYTPSLKGVDVLSILEGYGRDSISTFSTQHTQSEAARVFNLLLESNGQVTAEKAEDQLNKSTSSSMRAYLAVILADYAFVNYNFDSGLRYLKRAVDEHDPIRNDSYYRLVLARAQKAIMESPGKTNDGKNSILADYSPRVFTKEPTVKKVDVAAVKEAQKTVPKPDELVTVISVDGSETTKLEPEVKATTQVEPKIKEVVKKEPPVEIQINNAVNYRMQIGAFGVQENALKKQVYFEENGYPVHIEIRETSSKPLYLVQVGEFETYYEAKTGLARFKSRYPAEDGIVMKVKK